MMEPVMHNIPMHYRIESNQCNYAQLSKVPSLVCI